MSVEAWKCNQPDCKGYVVFENADFDIKDLEIIHGYYAHTDAKCTECEKIYIVVPTYTVANPEEEDNYLESVCMTEFDKRSKELKGELK